MVGKANLNDPILLKNNDKDNILLLEYNDKCNILFLENI